MCPGGSDISTVVAFAVSGVVNGLEVFWKVNAMMGIAMWASFFLEKSNSRSGMGIHTQRFFGMGFHQQHQSH
jgi:hypothetical protein